MSRRIKKWAINASLVNCLLAAGLVGCGNNQTGAELLAEAKQYQEKGDDKAALIQLKNAAIKSPQDAEVRFLLASLYNKTRDGASAEKEIRRAIEISNDKLRAAPDLAQALLLQGKPQKVIDETKDVADKASPALHAPRGEAYFALQQLAQSRDSFKQALSGDPGNARALVGLARIAVLDRDMGTAHALTDQAIKAYPKDTTPLIYKGLLLRLENRLDDAIAVFGKAIALQPTAVEPYLERANDEIVAKKFDAAKADLDAARKLAPDTVQLIFTEALYNAMLGKTEQAREGVQKVLSVAPEHLQSILLAGMIELKLGNTQAAEQYLKKYVDNYPDNINARTMLAQAMIRNSRGADAITTALGPMLKAGTQDPQLLALAGEALLQSKDFIKASEYFEKASALDPKNASLRTALAQSKLGMGDPADAISELEAAVALDPKSASAGAALVVTEIRLKRFDKALVAVEKLEQSQPENVELISLKGGVYMVQGDFQKARAAFEKAMQLKPEYFVPIQNLARMDRRDGKPDAARKRYEAFLEKNKSHYAAMWGLAELEMEQGRTSQATAWLEKASSQNPTLVAPAIKLGYHYLGNSEPQKALSLLRKFQATDHMSNPELLEVLGIAQMANNDLSGALDSFGKLASARPKSAAAHMRLAGTHLMSKNLPAAAADLKRAVAAEPYFLPARIGQIEVATRMGKWDEAQGYVRELQKMEPQNPLGYAFEGDLQLTQRHAAPALAAYEKAFALQKSPEVLIKVADALKLEGKWKEAEARLVQWSKANPSDAMIHLYLSQDYSSNKQYKEAAEALQAVLKLKPDNHVALNNLAWVYQQQKDPRAVETAERALKLVPDSPVILDTLGWMLVEQGNLARGLPLLQKAVRLSPAKDIRYHLALALQKSGDKVGARKELEKLFADRRPFPEAEEAKALLKVL